MSQQQPVLPGTPPIGWGAQPPGQPFPTAQAGGPPPAYQQPAFQQPGLPATQPPPGPPAYQPPTGPPAYQPPTGPPAYQPPTGPPAYQPPSGPPAHQPPGYPPQQFPGSTPMPPGPPPAWTAPTPPQQPQAPFPPSAPFQGTTPLPTQVAQPSAQTAQPPAQVLPTAPPQQTVPTQPGPAMAAPTQLTLFDTQPVQPAAAENPSIQQLIRNFSKGATCERYSADSEKIKLLQDYLWIRQLTPNLPFELFLELYAPVADFDDVNLKHPADAIKFRLPRTAKAAGELKLHHWSAKEVVDYVALYVDIIREAEATSSPLAMTFNEFLTSTVMIDGFLAGNFKEAPQPRSPSAPKTGTRAAKGDHAVLPSAAGQRVIYTTASGRQYRGVLTNYWQDAQSSNVFADFRADSGEDFKGIGIVAFAICGDPPPNAPQTVTGDGLAELDRGKLTIVKAQYPSVVQALSLPVALGTVAIGDNIYSFNHQFRTGHVAVIDVVNGETGPYVDARLCLNSADNVLAEINPPRKNIEGIYIFELPEGTFNLEIVGNQ